MHLNHCVISPCVHLSLFVTHIQLPLLQSDLYSICQHCIAGTLQSEHVVWKNNTIACTVVCSSPGYPEQYTTGNVYCRYISISSVARSVHANHIGGLWNVRNINLRIVHHLLFVLRAHGLILQAIPSRDWRRLKNLTWIQP